MSRVDYGTVELTVGDEEYTLTPTLDCVRKMKRWGLGSPMKAIEACREFDADMLAIVVAAGAGKGQKQLEQIAQDIHDEGVIEVTNHVVEFLTMLLNPTGKEQPDEKPEEKPEGE